MKFNADQHFIYIIARVDENKKQLQSYYNLMEEDLEEITKDRLVDLLIPADPADISNINSPETMQDTPRPRRTKKTEEVQELVNASVKTASISLEQGGDGEYLDEKDIEQNQGDEVDPLTKRKGFPMKPSS
jgi:hypothetical protein